MSVARLVAGVILILVGIAVAIVVAVLAWPADLYIAALFSGIVGFLLVNP
jgi:hypothetical protein